MFSASPLHHHHENWPSSLWITFLRVKWQHLALAFRYIIISHDIHQRHLNFAASSNHPSVADFSLRHYGLHVSSHCEWHSSRSQQQWWWILRSHCQLYLFVITVQLSNEAVSQPQTVGCHISAELYYVPMPSSGLVCHEEEKSTSITSFLLTYY